MDSALSRMPPEQSEKTILLVDDEENIIRSIKRILRKEGYSILTANSGQEGLNVLKENSVGVIISDQRMPEMSGVEFLSQVKKLYPDTVRIVLSGYTDLNSVTDAINQGAIYRFLTKPWDDELLMANIRDAFKRYGLYKENQRLNAELGRLNQKLENRVDEQNRESNIKQKMLQFTQHVMDSQPVGILGISHDGLIAIANQEAYEIFSEVTAKLLMGNISQVLPESVVGIYQQVKMDDTKTDKQVVLNNVNYRVLGNKIFSQEQGDSLGIVLVFIKW